MAKRAAQLNLPNDPQALLYRGQYADVIALYEKSEGPKRAKSLMLASVGALSFVGRMEEAQLLFDTISAKLNVIETSEALFFLVVNFARVQSWRAARTYYVRLAQIDKNKRTRFYRLQAAAFLRQGRSQFRSAELLLREAFAIAVGENFLYGKILSADLLGHTLIHLDRIREAIKHLKEAALSAQSMGADGLLQAIQVSTLLYESQLGLRSAENSIGELRSFIGKLRLSDSYSRINLYFELTRMLTLAGRYSEADQSLRAVLELIYLYNNPRQETIFKLRYAELHVKRGRFFDALEKILDAKRWSGLQHNPLLRAQVLGLEYKVVKALGFVDRLPHLESNILGIETSFHSALNHRITRRMLGLSAESNATSDDAIAPLFAKLNSPLDVVAPMILEAGYYSFLVPLLKMKWGAEALIWDLQPGTLTLISQEGIFHVPSLRSHKTRQILEHLAQGMATKESLVKVVWGYEYHPLKHDSLLYAAIAQCRKSLGLLAHWIENHENSYSLKSGVGVVHVAAPVTSPRLRVSSMATFVGADLNHRQLTFLRMSKTEELLSLKFYRQRFGVSRNTATRDLRDLERKGFLVAMGDGPSRRYTQSVADAIVSS